MLSRKLAARLPLLAVMLLVGCETVSSRPTLTVCLPVQEYSAEFQAQAADELMALPPESHLAQMITDYGRMRDQARACQEAVKGL